MSHDLLTAEQIAELRADARLGREIVDVLSHYCGERGESEGTVETLQRIIRERDDRDILRTYHTILREIRIMASSLDRLSADLGRIATDTQIIGDAIRAFIAASKTIDPAALQAAIEAQFSPLADTADALADTVDALAKSVAPPTVDTPPAAPAPSDTPPSA